MQIAHQPDYYIAGICIKDQWIGEFHATTEDLMEYAITSEGIGEPEMLLIDDMIEAQLVYKQWWERVSNANR